MSDTFTIAQFQAVTKLPLTAEFIVNVLGIPADEQVKRSSIWNRDKYGLILGRLQNYLNSCGNLDPTKAEKATSTRKPKEDAKPAGGDDPFAEDAGTGTSEADDPFAEDDGEELFA